MNPIQQLTDSNGRPIGLVMAANESSDYTHFSEQLTGYVAGLPDNQGLQELLDFLAPPIQVARRFEYRVNQNSRALAEEDDARAEDANFKEIKGTGKLETSRTINKGLTFIVDRDRIPTDVPSFEQNVVAWLRNMLLLRDIIRGTALLTAAATTTTVNWNTGSDPDSDFLMSIAASADADALEKNRGIMGSTMGLRRKLIYLAKTNNAVLAARAGLSMEDLADFFELAEFRKLRARQKSGTTYPPVLRSSAIFWNASQSPLIDDPSHIKRCWSACDGGGMWRVHREERGAKLLALTLEHYGQFIMPFTAGIARVYDSGSLTTPKPATGAAA